MTPGWWLRFKFSRQYGSDPVQGLLDLTGKVVIVTGGNSGIGFTTVQHLARKDAKVYVAARSEERAKAAIERLHVAGLAPGNGEVLWLELDLSYPRKVKQSAESFLSKESRLDLVVNNAGIMRKPYRVGPDVTDTSNADSHVSPVIFTRTLVPLMLKTAEDLDSDIRIVMVTSSFVRHLKGYDVRYRNLEDFNQDYRGKLVMADLLRYTQSKLANILYAKQLQKVLAASHPDAPITVLSVHPGCVNTEGYHSDPTNSIPILGPILRFFLTLYFLNQSEGAFVSVFAAAAPQVKANRENYMGAYLVPPGKIATPPERRAESAELAQELWDTTEAILKDWGIH